MLVLSGHGSSHPDYRLCPSPPTGALESQVPWATFVVLSPHNMVPFQTQAFYTPVVGWLRHGATIARTDNR